MVGTGWQTGVFTVCAVLAIALQTTWGLSLPQQILLLAPLVAVLGLPHGALDLPIAESLWSLHGWWGKSRFAALYLGLAGSVILVWWLAPGIALVAFLVYSALHFSDDWSRAVPPLRWTGGLATIGAPALLQHAEVTALFGYLAPSVTAGWSADAAALIGAGALAAWALTVMVTPGARGQAALEQGILWATALVLPPLMYFAVYFCALHSTRHFTATIRRVPRARRALVVAVLLSALVSLAGATIVGVELSENLVSMPELVVQVIFIGLAALTVPHMILVERFRAAGSENRA